MVVLSQAVVAQDIMNIGPLSGLIGSYIGAPPMREIYLKIYVRTPETRNPTKVQILEFTCILEARDHSEKLSGSGRLHSDKV